MDGFINIFKRETLFCRCKYMAHTLRTFRIKKITNNNNNNNTKKIIMHKDSWKQHVDCSIPKQTLKYEPRGRRSVGDLENMDRLINDFQGEKGNMTKPRKCRRRRLQN